MGMDVYGKSPKNESGEYFRASISIWPKVRFAMDKAGLDKQLNEAMKGNCGGLDKETAERIGQKLQEIIESNPCSLIPKKGEVESPISFDGLIAGLPPGLIMYRGDTTGEELIEKIESFAVFCINSGGFEVC